jgi:hypothetical protein
VQIRLLYKGRLLSTGNSRLKPVDPERDKDIHRIRRDLHRQLAVLWNKHPVLKQKQEYAYHWSSDWKEYNKHSRFDLLDWLPEQRPSDLFTEVEALMNRFNKCDYHFVPLVNDLFNTVCALDILFLRREDPGQLITTQTGGDIDNRIKTLFEALQIPTSCTQIDGLPQPDETPFFTLLQDDGLVTDLKVTTDRLLVPRAANEDQNDVVLVIQAYIKTSQAWFDAEEQSGLGGEK